MSATLRVEDFTNNKKLFTKKINVINVESRQFPVSTYFNKTTPDNYIDEALKKCKKIHKKLPAGDVLVFLTGEREIKEFCLKLEMELSRDENEDPDEIDIENTNNEQNLENKKIFKEKKNIFDPDSEEELLLEEGAKETEPKTETYIINKDRPTNFLIYPLFSKLSLEQQERIFQKHQENTRFKNNKI